MGTAAIPGKPLAGGSFPRSFLIPGTDTSIRVGGFVDFTALDFLQGGGNVNGSNYVVERRPKRQSCTSLPVGGRSVPGPGRTSCRHSVNYAPSRNNGVLEFSPQQSRLNVETRTPTAGAKRGPSSNSTGPAATISAARPCSRAAATACIPRLRFAYGTLGGFLAGQAISNFSDADADTESMEFGGTWARPAASASRRCATPSPAPTAAPSRYRRKTRSRR